MFPVANRAGFIIDAFNIAGYAYYKFTIYLVKDHYGLNLRYYFQRDVSRDYKRVMLQLSAACSLRSTPVVHVMRVTVSNVSLICNVHFSFYI